MCSLYELLHCASCCQLCTLNSQCMHCNFRPDGVGTVTHEEKEKFQEIKERLRILLENQITNFR